MVWGVEIYLLWIYNIHYSYIHKYIYIHIQIYSDSSKTNCLTFRLGNYYHTLPIIHTRAIHTDIPGMQRGQQRLGSVIALSPDLHGTQVATCANTICKNWVQSSEWGRVTFATHNPKQWWCLALCWELLNKEGRLKWLWSKIFHFINP